jgi:hypothetical protein
MTMLSQFAASLRAARLFAALAVVAAYAVAANAQSDAPIGRIEGDNISVKGEVTVVNENGHTYTALTSGSQVTVRSGRARIELAGGGEIGVCGPARFSLVRAGTSLTLALDYGRVRARVANPAELRIYTPQVQASPMAASGRADDLSVGLEESGKMCVHASSGALRLEPQFGGDNIVVPQGTEAILQDGQLASLSPAARMCGCDALDSKREAPAIPPPNAASRVPLVETAPTAQPNPPAAQKKPPQPPPSTPGEQPIWKIYAPPLTYDASAANAPSGPAKGEPMPPPTPETALIFREVVVEPTIVWRGTVEEPPKPAPPIVAEKTPPPADTKPVVEPDKKQSFGSRISGFFRRLFGGKPKQEKPSQESQPAANLDPRQPAYIPS